jgi:hypothetical protein
MGSSMGSVSSGHQMARLGECNQAPISWHTPRMCQEPVAAAPPDEPDEPLNRESHLSFWALTNSR